MLKILITAGAEVFNLGTGAGYSVKKFFLLLNWLLACKSGIKTLKDEGDVAIWFANPAKAEDGLGWRAQKTLAQKCYDGWRWQQNQSS